MALPPVYKYLNVNGAKLTLGNRNFRHAKPSDFKDIEDMTIGSIFPEETEVAIKRLSEGFGDVILKHVQDTPTCGLPMAATIAQMQALFRANPDAAAAVVAEIKKGGLAKAIDVAAMRDLSEAFVGETNEFMQNYRVLCVTTNNNSDKMWTDYAENHKGIALRIDPYARGDSKFELFRPVTYRDKRPSLYDNTLGFLEDRWFGDQDERVKTTLAKIIYSKTLKWKDECEYRLAIPLDEDEEPYETLPYYPEEITEMYLGLAMDKTDKADITAKATAVNPEIAIFQAKRGGGNAIVFDRL
jgi:hypothetical protein